MRYFFYIIFIVNITQANAYLQIDLSKYSGTWHEIARKPNSFQKNCIQTKAQYGLMKNGKVKVVNSCAKANGKIIQAEGIAWRTKDSNLLKVSFIPLLKNLKIFGSDYKIIKLGENYQYSIVQSGKKYLWILMRDPSKKNIYLPKIIAFLKSENINIDNLIYAQY